MVCRHCRNQHHDRCKGGTWCDCQHRESVFVRGNEQIDRLARNLGLVGHPDAGKTELALAAGDNDEAPRPEIGYVSPETLDLISMATTTSASEAEIQEYWFAGPGALDLSKRMKEKP